MAIDERHYNTLRAFLDELEGDIYEEIPSELHDAITKRMVETVLSICPLEKSSSILDVGCGQGLALEQFSTHGFKPVGITLGEMDLRKCREKGYEVYKMDQSFLEFEEDQFDLIWCRHCLEHSIFPFFTLHQFKCVVKPGGYLYAEVPAPDTSSSHQANRNHYSVLGKSMWQELISRSGFKILDMKDITFNTQLGPDMYWAFLAQNRT
ncbi:MAG: class I SAM-dependent methyltransferase [Deferribacteres bacterium]|nr:class I SAM-dependent methyltransferase [candidate division KSB1 bacterium]MCB9502206.1 class I SAM-dependent methyltransferase [Deferribacteres bacterium]